MNSVNIVGRLTAEVEVKETNSGKKYAKFSIAVRRDKDNSDFISCIAWEKTSEMLEGYVSKGQMVGITGRIQTGSYEGEKGKVYTTDVVVNSITLVEKKGEEAPKETKKESPKQPVEDSSDDFPF